ncbi:MAG: HDOD domain-containing protein [Candidatus Lernaella stagnicola]|nr:HDOD domain-containing protein [Candidatus Lernaella stagnicola]
MLIDEKAFRSRLDNLQNLPAFPGILDKFNEMATDPRISMSQIGDTIGKDQMLAMKILKLVNSAFYGFPGRISTVTHALVLLGYDVVKGLILSASVFDVMADKWRPLWKHSLAVSKATGIICKQMNLPNAEEIGMAGLLHDIGKVVLMIMEPEVYQTVIQAASKKGRPIVIAEQSMIGFTHSDVALWLCERWNLPQRLAAPMSFHHTPELATYAELATAVVFIGDNMVKAMGQGAEPNAPVEKINPAVTERVSISREQLVAIVEKLEPELESLGE